MDLVVLQDVLHVKADVDLGVLEDVVPHVRTHVVETALAAVQEDVADALTTVLDLVG